MSRRLQPTIRDVRRAYRLLGDCLDLRGDSVAWRTRLLAGLQEIVGARVAIYLHVEAPLTDRERVTEALSTGFLDDREQALWAHYQATGAHRDDPFHQAFYRRREGGAESLATRRLNDVVDRRVWQASRHCNDYVAACGLSDRIVSSLSLPGACPAREQTLVLHRDAADGAYRDSARYLVHLIHHELAALQVDKLTLPGAPADTSPLSPRLREVLAGLRLGESEKEIAARLNVSVHTVNRHIQRLYRYFGVNSRARLLAMLREQG